MKTDKTDVFQLFESKRRYLVPIFQRGYVWTRFGQWQRLWEDIVDQAEGVRAAGHNSNYRRAHFLGAVVVSQTAAPLKHVPTVEIIDGQQRLLTLLVLLAVLRDSLSGLLDAYLRSELEHLTTNADPVPHSDEKLKVWPTNAFHADLKNIMTAGSAERLEALYPQKRYYGKMKPPRPTLVEAYLFFAECLRLYIREPSDDLSDDMLSATPSDRAEWLVQALTRHLQLVTIELEADDDPQVIFQTLNAHGVPLAASDLVRNFVFLEATRRSENTDDLYGESWRQFDEDLGTDQRPFWREDERQGRLKRPRLDLFLFHFVAYQIGHEVKIGNLFEEFRSWWDGQSSHSVRELLVSLAAVGRQFRSLMTASGSSPLGRIATALRVLDTTTVYPLLLWYLDPATGGGGPDQSAIFRDLESYLVRRAVCGLGQKNYNKVFLMVLTRLRTAGDTTPAGLRHELMGLTGESSFWPSDSDFRQHLVFDPLYRVFNPRKTQFLLQSLDRASRASYSEQLEIKGALTVEHVLPQAADEEDWPFPWNPSEDESVAIERRYRLTQSLGNLTLLTQTLNSSVSNGPYFEKRPAIAEQSLLALNSYFQTQKSWGESAIVERGEVLATKAIAVWPRG